MSPQQQTAKATCGTCKYCPSDELKECKHPHQKDKKRNRVSFDDGICNLFKKEKPKGRKIDDMKKDDFEPQIVSSDIIKLQLHHLNLLQAITTKPILIKVIEGEALNGNDHRLYEWNYYKDIIISQPIYTRRILDNEILLDPDVKEWNVLKREFDKLTNYFHNKNIPYRLSYSGGNGCHASIIFYGFEIDKTLFTDIEKYDIDVFKIIRQILTFIIFNESGANEKALKIDNKKINFGKYRLGSMVRTYGTLRPNGNFKTLIDSIPEKKPEINTLPLRFPENIIQWNISDHQSLINTKLKEAIEKAKNTPDYKEIDITGCNLSGFPCIDTLIKEGTATGRYYGAGAIALLAKRTGISWEGIEPKIRTYLKKCATLDNTFSASDIELRINNTRPLYESKDYQFSCRYIKEVFTDKPYCDFGNCIICKKINNSNEDIFDDECLGDIKEQEEKKQAYLDLSGIPIDNFIMKHINYGIRLTDAYPEYHFGNALFLLSLASDRKIQVRFAHDTIFSNTWFFLIGDSTIARKTASITIGHEKIGIPVFGFDRYLPQSTSPEALIEELSNDPKTSLVRDEAGGFLRELDKNYMAGFKDVLCSIYDNKDYHRKIRTSQRKGSQTDFNIQNPFVNILFATTPDIFKNYTNYLDVTSGWLVRFLYITPDHEKEWKGYRKETQLDIDLKYDTLRQLETIKNRIEKNPDVVDFELSNDAMDFYTIWQRSTETEAMKSKDKNKLRVLGRMHTYAIKISMLILLGDNNDTKIIPKKYIEIACNIVENYFLINACNLMEDICRDEKHNLQDKIIGILKTYGRVTLRDIMRYAHQPKRDLFEALEALDEHGSYEIKKIQEKGRKTIFYEINGSKSKKSKFTNVANVTNVTNVTTVPTVTEDKGIIATNVTDEIYTRVITNNKPVYLCDSGDKSDNCDNRDKKDNKEKCNTVTELSELEIKIEKSGKYWETQNCKSINSSNKTEFSIWYCNDVKDGSTPKQIMSLIEKVFKLTPISQNITTFEDNGETFEVVVE